MRTLNAGHAAICLSQSIYIVVNNYSHSHNIPMPTQEVNHLTSLR